MDLFPQGSLLFILKILSAQVVERELFFGCSGVYLDSNVFKNRLWKLYIRIVLFKTFVLIVWLAECDLYDMMFYLMSKARYNFYEGKSSLQIAIFDLRWERMTLESCCPVLFEEKSDFLQVPSNFPRGRKERSWRALANSTTYF